MSSRRITTKTRKDGVSQTVNIHIHDKAEKKKRRRRRKKVSTSGSIRSITRSIPPTSSSSQGVIPQRRFSQQQLIALPEGDKALGQSGMLGYKVPQPQQLTYQKELLKLAMREYEAEVRGKSTKARDVPVDDIIVTDLDDQPRMKPPPFKIDPKTGKAIYPTGLPPPPLSTNPIVPSRGSAFRPISGSDIASPSAPPLPSLPSGNTWRFNPFGGSPNTPPAIAPRRGRGLNPFQTP